MDNYLLKSLVWNLHVAISAFFPDGRLHHNPDHVYDNFNKQRRFYANKVVKEYVDDLPPDIFLIFTLLPSIDKIIPKNLWKVFLDIAKKKQGKITKYIRRNLPRNVLMRFIEVATDANQLLSFLQRRGNRKRRIRMSDVKYHRFLVTAYLFTPMWLNDMKRVCVNCRCMSVSSSLIRIGHILHICGACAKQNLTLLNGNILIHYKFDNWDLPFLVNDKFQSKIALPDEIFSMGVSVDSVAATATKIALSSENARISPMLSEWVKRFFSTLVDMKWRKRRDDKVVCLRQHLRSRLCLMLFAYKWLYRARVALNRPAFQNGESCAICLDDYGLRKVCRSVKPCGHIFHTGCITRWIESRNTCPMCRTMVKI